jgi:hypothetical protein
MKKNLLYILVFIVSFVLIDQSVGRIILYGINCFYGLNQHSDLLVVGHSHIMLSIDKDRLESGTGLKVSKYTREGVNLFDRQVMVEQYLRSAYGDSLKMVMYGVDQFSFVKSGLSENSYKLFYPFMEDQVMDTYIEKSTKNKREYYAHKLFHLTRYSDPLLNAAIRGYRNDFSNYKYGTLDVEQLKKNIADGNKQFAREMTIDPELLSAFEKTIKTITDRGIRVILVNTPTLDLLKDADRISYQKTIEIFQLYADNSDLIEYWDFNPEYESDYSIFYDPIHLNPRGQQLITDEIINRLNNCFF